jgi:hypothetical protein
VTLHCTVWPQKDLASSLEYPPQGVFDIAASVEHSATLVQRATLYIEVYIWENVNVGALDLLVMQDSSIRLES